jgi:L-ascorbate metabolism protein UlaG (beta-lactamase superfamily)
MEISWFGHGTIRLFTFGHTILVDPLRANAKLATTLQPDQEPRASVVLITADKRDHLEPETVKAASELRAVVAAPRPAMKALLRIRRTDVHYVIAKHGERIELGRHLTIRCLGTREGYDPGIVYVVEGPETIVFLGDSLMDKSGWAVAGIEKAPTVVVYPAYLAHREKARGEAFREWIGDLGPVSCIPILYHSSPHADPVYFVKADDVPKTIPPTARMDQLSHRPLVAHETRRMRRRI